MKQKKRKRSYQAALERKGLYSIDEVRDITKEYLFSPSNEKPKVELDGDLIKANSQRYQTFFTKGTKCVCCGIEGRYFAKERGNNDKSYHLNLYAINDVGKEILMTKDHIIPKSKGGKNNITNYQPMCVICNVKKGNKIQKG